MSPAIITPLTHEDYYVRFNRKSSTAAAIFLVQLMHPSPHLPYRCYVLLKVRSHWVFQWCEQVPASNYAFERMKNAPPTPAHYWTKENAQAFNCTFEEILTAICAGTPDTLPWK